MKDHPAVEVGQGGSNDGCGSLRRGCKCGVCKQARRDRRGNYYDEGKLYPNCPPVSELVGLPNFSKDDYNSSKSACHKFAAKKGINTPGIYTMCYYCCFLSPTSLFLRTHCLCHFKFFVQAS